MAAINIVIPFSLITWGEQSIDSGLAAILNGTVPLFAIVLAAMVLVDEPITLNRLAGLLIGFAGVILITSPTFDQGIGGSFEGELALIGSAISYAAAGVWARRMMRDAPAVTSAFGEVGFAFVITVVLAFVFEQPMATRVEVSTVVSVVWLGLIGSGLAFIGFFFLLSRWGATRTSLVAYLLPVVGVVLGVLVLQESVSLPVLLGMVLIIGGVALANTPFGQRRLIGRRLPEAVPEAPAQAGD
jgi:drug/metabolite transporter (DMT)-like permease